MSDDGDLTPAPGGYPIKLVRDGTASKINSTGEPGELFYAQIPSAERLDWLRKKLGEEVTEYLVGGDFAELCDVLAVVEALAVEEGRSVSYLRHRTDLHPRGGFFAGVMMFGRHPEFDGEASS